MLSVTAAVLRQVVAKQLLPAIQAKTVRALLRRSRILIPLGPQVSLDLRDLLIGTFTFSCFSFFVMILIYFSPYAPDFRPRENPRMSSYQSYPDQYYDHYPPSPSAYGPPYYPEHHYPATRSQSAGYYSPHDSRSGHPYYAEHARSSYGYAQKSPMYDHPSPRADLEHEHLPSKRRETPHSQEMAERGNEEERTPAREPELSGEGSDIKIDQDNNDPSMFITFRTF